jgi:cation transporter-like permease
MPLDDREQKILEEIERQFYQEDPKLAESVRTASLASAATRNLKWALLAFVVGTAVMLGLFTRFTLAALAGFVVMVLSVAWIVAILRHRAGVSMRSPTEWWRGVRQRYRRGG